MSKIARDLNIKNIEERVFELEKNPGGGISEVPLATDEAVGGFKTGNGYNLTEDGEIENNFIKNNFKTISENTTPGSIVLTDNDYKVLEIYAGDYNFYGQTEVTKDLRAIRNFTQPYKNGVLQLYIGGYYSDLTDANSKVTPVYNNVDYTVEYDIGAIPNLNKLAYAGAEYMSPNGSVLTYGTARPKSFKMTPASFSLPSYGENLLRSVRSKIDNQIILYLDEFEQKTAFSNNDFTLKLLVGATMTQNGQKLSSAGFMVDEIKSARLVSGYNNAAGVKIRNCTPLNAAIRTETVTLQEGMVLYNTYIVITDINIDENEFIYSRIVVDTESENGVSEIDTYVGGTNGFLQMN